MLLLRCYIRMDDGHSNVGTVSKVTDGRMLVVCSRMGKSTTEQKKTK